MTPAVVDQLAEAAQGNAAALMTLAHHVRRSDRRRAATLSAEALALLPHDPELRATAVAIAAAGVPKWHFRMMRDAGRNSAYAAAIDAAVRPGMRVLDIGAGSGLLSMLAARAGAASVVGCEMDPVVAAVARDVIAANGLAGRVTILDRHSASLDAESDLGGRADVIVSEILGKDLVCEGVLPALRDAARRLLAPGGRMVPARGQVRVALAQWHGRARMMVGEELGFDLSAFNRLLPAGIGVPVGDAALRLCGEPANLFDFDFSATGSPSTRATAELVARGGTVDGVVQWIALDLDESVRFENMPQAGSTSSWAAVFHGFDEPIDTVAGDRVRIGGRVLDDRLILWREGG